MGVSTRAGALRGGEAGRAGLGREGMGPAGGGAGPHFLSPAEAAEQPRTMAQLREPRPAAPLDRELMALG